MEIPELIDLDSPEQRRRKEPDYLPERLSSESDSYKLSTSSAHWTESQSSVAFEGLRSQLSDRDEDLKGIELPGSRYADRPITPESPDQTGFNASISSPDYPVYKGGIENFTTSQTSYLELNRQDEDSDSPLQSSPPLSAGKFTLQEIEEKNEEQTPPGSEKNASQTSPSPTDFELQNQRLNRAKAALAKVEAQEFSNKKKKSGNVKKAVLAGPASRGKNKNYNVQKNVKGAAFIRQTASGTQSGAPSAASKGTPFTRQTVSGTQSGAPTAANKGSPFTRQTVSGTQSGAPLAAPQLQLPQEPKNYQFKIVLVGDPDVGKTQICNKYDSGSMQTAYIPTNGIAYKFKVIQGPSGDHCKLNIWDTPGGNGFQNVKNFLSDVQGVIIVYAADQQSTLISVSKWINEFAGQDVQMILVGNKFDRQPEISDQYLKEIIAKHNLDHFKTSARNGNSIEEIFSAITEKIVANREGKRKQKAASGKGTLGALAKKMAEDQELEDKLKQIHQKFSGTLNQKFQTEKVKADAFLKYEKKVAKAQPPPVTSGIKVLPKDMLPLVAKKLTPARDKAEALTLGHYEIRQLSKNPSKQVKKVIEIISKKLSNGMTQKEIRAEKKACLEVLRLIKNTPKESKRGGMDIFEETKVLVDFYMAALEQNIDLDLLLKKDKTTLLNAQEGLSRTAQTRAVIPTDKGKYMREGAVPESNIFDILENIPDDILRDDPIDAVIYKLERNDISLDTLFSKLDEDSDGVLTMMEIRMNITSIGVDLTPNEVTTIIQKLDENSDSTVTREEFNKLLNPQLAKHKKYKELIGDIEINNPMAIEEQILDMKTKGKFYKSRLPDMHAKLTKKMPTQKRHVRKIKQLEQLLAGRKIVRDSNQDDLTFIYAEITNLTKKREQTKQNTNRKQIDAHLMTEGLMEKLGNSTESVEQVKFKLVRVQGDKSVQDSKLQNLSSLDEKVNQQNFLIAAVMIQTYYRRFKKRYEFKQLKTSKKHAVRVISNGFLNYKALIKAKILLQKWVRGFLARKKAGKLRFARDEKDRLAKSTIADELTKDIIDQVTEWGLEIVVPEAMKESQITAYDELLPSESEDFNYETMCIECQLPSTDQCAMCRNFYCISCFQVHIC